MTILGENFCFIHVYKTGGTSIGTALQPVAGSRFIPNTHSTAEQVAAALGKDVWNRLFTFGFVRNPFDLCISLYEYIRTGHPEYTYAANHTFLEWLVRQYSTIGKPDSGAPYFSMSDVLCDVNGKPLVTFVGRYERLAEDFAAITQEIGCPHLRLGHLRKSTRKAFGDYYRTLEEVEIVQATFAKDFEISGYSTDPKDAVA